MGFSSIRRLFPRATIAALCGLSFLAITIAGSRAAEPLALIDTANPKTNWNFSNGQEFPGATGSLTVDAAAGPSGQDCLKIVGDFTKGGAYVGLGRKLPKVDIQELAIMLRFPGSERITLMLNDAAGQTHKFDLRLEPSEDWQLVVLPLERYFAKRGTAAAVTGISKYETWGGPKDGQWHGPAVGMFLSFGKSSQTPVRTMWLGSVTIVPRATQVESELTSTIALDEIAAGQHAWRFSKGEEFKGAQGSLTVVAEGPMVAGRTEPQPAFKLQGDFTGGGAYVAMVRSFEDLQASDIQAIRLQVKSDSAAGLGIQLVDGSGQTHQKKGVKIVADGAWHELVLKPREIAGGEHWGGANDGKWHPGGKLLAISLASYSDPEKKQPVVYLADIRVDATIKAVVKPAAFQADFEFEKLPADWQATGGVKLDPAAAASGTKSLTLSRTLEGIETPCRVVGPSFAATAGTWEIKLESQADLHSPDNSYQGAVELECLDAGGKLLERILVAEIYGRHDWQPLMKRVAAPPGTRQARLTFALKKTYGTLRLDAVSAAYLATAGRRDDRIQRVLFRTAQLGNLLFPTDSREVTVTVEATKPLLPEQETLTYVVRDYWGAEQMPPQTVQLGAPKSEGERLVYSAALDLHPLPLEVGRYYEVHAAVAQPGDEPFSNYTSLAILPEAVTKQYKPEEIPFLSRNWDNRISEYIRLTDRLGLRVCGVWGAWSMKAPYKAEAPGLDLVKELQMGWLTNTPIATIERGQAEVDEEALRQGVRNLLEKFGDYRPMYINLGNEPHGKGERVEKNVAAYRLVYEAVKQIDPTIPVVATSVEPNEEYFRLGYGKYCDFYDFHIYEEFPNVRRTIQEYQALMKKYDVVRPIWSTELGLNSQGMTRHSVAVELVKKFSTFFAAGGQKVSWFGILYPDADGKSFGSSGDAHNVFDCRYKRYCPRLDAVAYYHMVNAIAIKKFVAEKSYSNGVSAFLFRDRDGRTLQVIWKDRGRADVFVPLSGVGEIEVIRIDGGHRKLFAEQKGVTLTATRDPLLLLYQDGPAELAADLPAAPIALDAPTEVASLRGPVVFTLLLGATDGHRVNLIAPPFWKVAKELAHRDGQPIVTFTLTPPASSSLHALDLTLSIDDAEGKRRGELYHRATIGE